MLNLKFYKGSDLYSDGDIEEEIRGIVECHPDGDFTDVLRGDHRWPVLYHLSPDRRNLLEWYPFEKNASLLEIGAGCGALTGLFCEKLGSVTAVELSKRRAEIILSRNQGRKNLDVFAGNFDDMEFEGTFDYITLIGVLEYVKGFSSLSVDAFLGKIKRLLKKDGRLFVAIENKYGLKYWAGAKEDHTGEYFGGLEGYGGKKAETYSRDVLGSILGRNGFTDREFYYPVPDYKLPTEIFSDDYLPNITSFANVGTNYDDERHVLFDEKRVLMEIIEDGLFPQYSNSFLLVAGGNP